MKHLETKHLVLGHKTNINVLQKNFEMNLSISDAAETFLFRVCEKSGIVPHMTSNSISQQKKEATCIACFISALMFIAILQERRLPPIPTRTDHADQDRCLKSFILLTTIWRINP